MSGEAGQQVVSPARRLVGVTIDETSIGTSSPDIEHEREVAVYDLLEHNEFALSGQFEGPYRLTLSIVEKRLVFQIDGAETGEQAAFVLSLTPFRRIIKDYFLVCESYYQAIKTAAPSQIEAIDMGRRGLHNEGSQTLKERLAGKLDVDFDTARRLFTLVCVLHWRG